MARLLDSKTQEELYETILDRCLQLHGSKGDPSSLSNTLQALTLHPDKETAEPRRASSTAKEQSALDNIYQNDRKESSDLTSIVQAMRKLREAIVASGRTDQFVQGVYVFIIRATILLRHMESYHPALLHLLHRLHCKTLPDPILHEMLGYHILDLACRMQNMSSTYSFRLEYGFHDSRIDRMLKAIAHGNWVAFWRSQDAMTVYEQRLLEHASDDMRLHVIQCLSKTYLTIPRKYVEYATQKPWTVLTRKYSTNWTLEGANIIIKPVIRK